MNVEVIEAPAFAPVTLQEVYDHLRLDPEGSPPAHEDDAMLERHITSATSVAEKRTRRSLVRQRLRLYASAFPCHGRGLELLRPPFLSVESVSYYDESNQLQPLDAANWYVTSDAVPQVRLATAFSAPRLYARPDAVRVDYTTGYAPVGSPPTDQADYAANVPGPIKTAILLGVELLYDPLSPAQREQIELARAAQLADFKVYLAP